MAPLKRCAISTFGLAAALVPLALAASAQITEIREYHGEKIACSVSGLRGFYSVCGLDPFYDFIFIGSVVSSAEISEMEFRLQLRPEEVFLGVATDILEVKTNQGDCLPELVPGDRWLFFLRRDKEDHALRLDYGSGSGPEKDAQQEIDLLRRLLRMDHAGYVHGYVSRLDWSPPKDANSMAEEDHVALPNHKVIATRKPGGKPFSAFTDKKGDYEFEPLPVGSYELSANTAAGLWAKEGPVEVTPHSCTSVGFELEPAGTIAGQLTTPDGVPAPSVEVYAVAVSKNDRLFESSWTDEQGHYEISGLRPGRYLVGVESEPGSASSSESEMKLKVYYPGVPLRAQAMEIDLDQAGKRMDVDFQVPRSVVP